MAELIRTDIGLISKENANWLYSEKILSYKGNILNTSTPGLSDKNVLLYSYLLWALQGVRESCPTTPNGVYLCFDDYLTLARSGKLEKPYTYEGQEYCFVTSRAPVGDITRVGKEVCIAHQPEGKKKKWDASDFNF